MAHVDQDNNWPSVGCGLGGDGDQLLIMIFPSKVPSVFLIFLIQNEFIPVRRYLRLKRDFLSDFVWHVKFSPLHGYGKIVFPRQTMKIFLCPENTQFILPIFALLQYFLCVYREFFF